MTGHYLKDVFLFTITLSLTGENRPALVHQSDLMAEALHE